MIDFLLIWASCYISIVGIGLCLDNICWIPDSKEWGEIRKNFWVFIVPWFKGKRYEFAVPINSEGLRYCWKNRILEVLTHPRDILPGIISSFILTLIFKTLLTFRIGGVG